MRHCHLHHSHSHHHSHGHGPDARGWHFTGRHRGGRGFRGFRGGSGDQGDFGHRGLVRGRKIGSDDLQLLLLLLLAERPSHGYELIRALEQRSAGFYAPSPGMIYPALTYLEELQQATVRLEGTRKLYELAPAGREHLERNRAQAEAVMEQLEHFGQRMASFAGNPSMEGSTGGRREPAHRPRRLSFGSSVDAVLARLHDESLAWRASRRGSDSGPRSGGSRDPHQFADAGFSISPEQGELIYLLCRSLKARRVVDFATSLGVSAVYLAAALRDNGGGTVISAELVPQKVAAAHQNLVAAGLDSYVELRTGDARETLRDLSEPVDFALIDGWPVAGESSLALEVFRIVAPQIRSGGMVLNDNAEPDYLAYVRDPANGFISITLPLKGGTELSLKR
jgi:predicted O-methyltransferase YrrM/DNA-binding PadR family transcriptional regulator